MKKFGKDAFRKWFSRLNPEAQKIYSQPINKTEWFPLAEALIEPTMMLCKLFYNGNLKGAYECGVFSAEYGLKGVYKILVKMSSPQILIKKAGKIFANYYEGTDLQVFEVDKKHIIIRVMDFPEMDACIEQRVAGWMHRAVEITGSKRVNVKLNMSRAKNDPFTEYAVTWQTDVIG
ncbi:hypothetical protein ACFL67_00865 [candidate division KSB1 bacterium]